MSAVNFDPNLSEVEFLRSIVRQVRHIANLTADQSDFGLTKGDAIARIIDVCLSADGREPSDDDVIRQLRQKIGDLESRLIDQALLVKRVGLADAMLHEYEVTIGVLKSQRDALKDRVAALVERAAAE